MGFPRQEYWSGFPLLLPFNWLHISKWKVTDFGGLIASVVILLTSFLISSIRWLSWDSRRAARGNWGSRVGVLPLHTEFHLHEVQMWAEPVEWQREEWRVTPGRREGAGGEELQWGSLQFRCHSRQLSHGGVKRGKIHWTVHLWSVDFHIWMSILG